MPFAVGRPECRRAPPRTRSSSRTEGPGGRGGAPARPTRAFARVWTSFSPVSFAKPVWWSRIFGDRRECRPTILAPARFPIATGGSVPFRLGWGIFRDRGSPNLPQSHKEVTTNRTAAHSGDDARPPPRSSWPRGSLMGRSVAFLHPDLGTHEFLMAASPRDLRRRPARASLASEVTTHPSALARFCRVLQEPLAASRALLLTIGASRRSQTNSDPNRLHSRHYSSTPAKTPIEDPAPC